MISITEVKNPNNTIVELHIPCPKCPSSDGYCVYGDGHGHCFVCNYFYWPKKDEEFIKIMSEPSLSVSYDFVDFRGIRAETFEFYKAKTKLENGKPVAIGYPFKGGAYKIRDLTKPKGENWRTEGEISVAGCFGVDCFSAGESKYVTITEGMEDALSVYQALGSKYPVVSIQSSVTAKRDAKANYDWLNAFERIYLCMDNDARGRDASEAVASLFDFNKIYEVKLTKYKDANDYLQHGESEELKRIWWASKRYLPEGVISNLGEMEEEVLKTTKRGLPYPFAKLNAMTYGIRKGESVIIAAQEGVGKTEIMRAIEYKLLTETQENVAAIFLEEPRGHHLKRLVGLHLGSPAHLPDHAPTTAEVHRALQETVGKDDRLHLYSHFDTDDPDAILERVRFLVSVCDCGVVLLDHLSLVVSGNRSEDERIELDYIATRLQNMVKDLNFALIYVCHVNDYGQIRGSRYPAKLAQTRIDATRDIAGGSMRTILTVSKNRFASLSGPAGVLVFDPSTFTLSEEAANDNGGDTLQQAA